MTFLPKKIYLNGADCFHLILEKSRELSGEGNNQLYVCLQLASAEALKEIEATVNSSPLLDWIANIRLTNPPIGVPFYRYIHQGKKLSIRKHGHFNEQFPAELLSKVLSVKNNQFFSMDSYQSEGKNYLLLSFHHILFDGKGAGMVVQHLAGNLPVTSENVHLLFPGRPRWKNPVKQWLNLITVKRTVERTNRGKTAYLPVRHSTETGFGLLSRSFSKEETERIRENAVKNGVRFGLNFFQVACIAKVYRNFLADTDTLWIPIPYNGRKRGAAGTIISNYTSFVFHRLTVTPGTSLKEIAGQLQQQMNEQLKNDLPGKYNRLLQLMRFFPAWFNHLVTVRASKGKIASFLYSSTETGEHTNKQLIEKQWILPPFSYPPGCTINFYTHHDCLHFHIAYSRKMLDPGTANLFAEALAGQLNSNEDK